MTNPFRAIFFFLLGFIIAGAICPPLAAAHPEDEICVGNTGMDPVLCRALQDMDRSGGDDGLRTNQGASAAIRVERSVLATASLYIQIGVRHILPGGADHILFVLALFLGARRLRPLIVHISIFTLGHTATLAAVAAGLIAPPSGFVEVLIAASIAFMAFGAVAPTRLTRTRLLVIFAFGLVHGMGFAGFFGTLGLPDQQFWSALVGFNLGVEAGQLVIIGFVSFLAWLVQKRLHATAYRHFIIWPAAGLIGLIGIVWAMQRLLALVAF